MTGRTTWWPCDAAEHDRELNVELGEEHGPAGPLLMRVLKDLAQQQRDEGAVRTGFRAVARKCFIGPDLAAAIIAHAAEIGALDDLEVDDDRRRFTCRISGWIADAARGRAAIRKAQERTGEDEPDAPDPTVTDRDVVTSSVTEGDESRSVPHRSRSRSRSTRPEQTKEEPRTSTPNVEPSRLDAHRKIQDLFAYWQQTCQHPQAKLTKDRRTKIEARLRDGYGSDEICLAIDGARRSPFVGVDGKRFDDIELICRSGSKLEDFKDRATRPLTPFANERGGQVTAAGLQALKGTLG